jgi:hypothetical protein
MFTFSDNELNTLFIISLICIIIVIAILCMFIISYILVKSMRTFSNELVFYLCCSELLANIFNLLNDSEKYSVKCMMHAFGKTTFPLMSILFSSCIQLTVYFTVLKLFDLKSKINLVRIVYLAASIFVPIIFGIV